MARTTSSGNYFSSSLLYNLPTNCTLCWWAKTSDTSSSMAAFGRRNSGGFAVRRPGATNILLTYFGVADMNADTNSWPADGTWYPFVITKSGTSITFYRSNGTAKGTATATYTTEPSNGLYVGAYNNGGSADLPFIGSLAEIAFFSRTLDATDIGRFMAGDSPQLYDTSLDHYWKLDETSGNAAATYGGVTLTQVGTVTSDTHPTINYGATLEQEGHRWGNDDGSESAHTWAAAQDANITAPASQALLLNFLVNLTGTPGATSLKVQVSPDGVDQWADIPPQ